MRSLLAEAVVQFPNGHQAGIGGDQPALEIGNYLFTPMERKGMLLKTLCHLMASLAGDLEIVNIPIIQVFGGHFYTLLIKINE